MLPTILEYSSTGYSSTWYYITQVQYGDLKWIQDRRRIVKKFRYDSYSRSIRPGALAANVRISPKFLLD